MQRLERAEGICSAIKEDIDVKILQVTPNYVDAIFYSSQTAPWMCTFTYGSPYWQEEAESWEAMQEVVSSYGGPWRSCLVSKPDRQKGGRPRTRSASSGHERLMNSLGLVDLGLTGNQFTWKNRRERRAHVKERPDRGVANVTWRETFPRATVKHLPILGVRSCTPPAKRKRRREQQAVHLSTRRDVVTRTIWQTIDNACLVTSTYWLADVWNEHEDCRHKGSTAEMESGNLRTCQSEGS